MRGGYLDICSICIVRDPAEGGYCGTDVAPRGNAEENIALPGERDGVVLQNGVSGGEVGAVRQFKGAEACARKIVAEISRKCQKAGVGTCAGELRLTGGLVVLDDDG